MILKRISDGKFLISGKLHTTQTALAREFSSAKFAQAYLKRNGLPRKGYELCDMTVPFCGLTSEEISGAVRRCVNAGT